MIIILMKGRENSENDQKKRVFDIDVVCIIWVLWVWSVLCVKEGDDAFTDIAKKIVEFFFSVESVPLSKSGVVVSDMFPDFVVKVTTKGRNQQNSASDDCQTLSYSSHWLSIIILT